MMTLLLLPEMTKALSFLPNVTYIIHLMHGNILFGAFFDASLKISPDVHISMSVVLSKHYVALVIRDLFQQCCCQL